MGGLSGSGFKWADGREVQGYVPLEKFPLNFTLMTHAGISGLVFVSFWFGWHWNLWSKYNWGTAVAVSALFLLLAWTSVQFGNNIVTRRLTLRKTPKDYDWFRYARSTMKFQILLFSANTSMLIWATGGLSSPFIPFYIMVFILALSYCQFPQPASNLTFAFVIILSIFLILAELPWIHRYIPAPVDDNLQAAISSGIAKKFFDGGFVMASMLVPLLSMFFAAHMAPESIPASPATPDIAATGNSAPDPTHAS